MVQYILREAGVGELAAVAAAVEVRQAKLTTGADPPSRATAQNPPVVDKESVAGEARRISGQLTANLDFKAMAREVVGEIVRKQEPSIPEEHLDLLLDEWLPDDGDEQSSDKERAIPRQVVLSMVRQFVAHSVGALPSSEAAQLPTGWERRYWSVFSATTRGLIANLISGEVSPEQFWASMQSDQPTPT